MGNRRSRDFEEVEAIDDDDDEDYEYDEELIYARQKRNQKIIISILVIIIIFIGVFYFVVISPPGVLGIYPGDPELNEEKDGLILRADVALKGSGKAEGDGTLKITHLKSGDTTYSSKVSVSGGKVLQEVKFDQFVTKNGDYEIELSYEDITKSFDNYYNINWIVEKLDVKLERMSRAESENLTSSDEPYLYLKVDMNTESDTRVYQTRPLDVDVEFFHEDQVSSFRTDSFTIDKSGTTSIDKKFNYQNSGNITAKVSIVNTFVKSDSEFRTIEGEGTNFINTMPVAHCKLDDSDGVVTLTGFGSDNGIASFDASKSFDSDGTIIKYQWNFGDESDDNIVVTTVPEVTHKYTEAKTYTVILTVIDQNTDDPLAYGDFDLQVVVRLI